MNLTETIQQARTGDVQAFRGLFEHYRKPVFRFVHGMLGQRQDSEDVLQEVFVALYRKMKTLNGVDDFEGWLFRVARNKAVDLIRNNVRRRLPAEDDMTSLEMDQAPSANDPHISSENKNLEKQLAIALRTVPEQTRAAFLLAVVQGFSYREVATIMGCSVNNIKAKVFRARTKLAKALDSVKAYEGVS